MAKTAQKRTTKSSGGRKTRAKAPATKGAAAKTATKRRRATTRAETVNITPSPRILKVLGDIEFEPWQCIAELTDNSFDEFAAIKRSGRPWREPMEVGVEIPAQGARKDATFVVRDNGRGMTLDRVSDAVRAGWTANDPFSKLGLFGMGFNVATARLGKVTRVLTTRSGDAEWVGVEIDLDNLGADFRAPVVRRSKSSLEEHGTRVEVSRLDQRSDWLRRPGNQRKLRGTLGAVYSYLLESEGFRLSVNGVQVKPVRHCVWSEERSVVRRRENIPAVIKIDKARADRAVCHDCGTWQDTDNKRCDECGGENLEVRERRVWGWVGIQRYLDRKQFGIDFLRNGRKILRFDKSLFQWRDPDDPSEAGDTEYPIELPANQGRIVGEIHIDHVPVTYTKDGFDTSDKGWRDAVKIVRGDGPLLPDAAKRLGIENNSPLARLHRGYRRNDPGRNYLTPGNGKTRIDTAEWNKKFHAGDPDYQDDEKWWQAVVRHDDVVAAEKRAKEERERAAAEGLEDPTKEFVDTGEEVSEEPEAEGDGAASEPRTDRERIEELLRSARPITELDGSFTADGIPGRPVKLKAYEVVAGKVTGSDGKRVPVWLAPQRGGSFAAFVDLDHPHFARFDDDPADLVLTELAQHLIARTTSGTPPPISAVFASLKQRYLVSRTIDQAQLDALATQQLRDIKKRMTDCVAENPERPWANALNDAERHLTEDRIVRVLKTADVDAAVLDGRYLALVPDSVIPRIVEEWPEAFFDEQLFRAPYRDVGSASARRQTVATVAGYLDDVAWLAEAPHETSRERLIRARFSLHLLPDELIDLAE
jgi:hypothetical protein